MEPPRWTIITPSLYEWERRGLDFIRTDLPDHDPYRAWANFEFLTSDGAIYEVDLLVLTKMGFWLVETKAWEGRIYGDAGAWTISHDGRLHSEDNPVLLANRKAKALASLLKSQPAVTKVKVPWLDALVFLSADNLQCDLTGPARNRVCLRDPEDSLGSRQPGGILEALINRVSYGIDPDLRTPIDIKVANPPYITVKDKAQNEAYRGLYSTCHRQYSLGVPFTQRFWEMAIQQGEANGGCGYIGEITANSFMNREFGKKLIEEFFPKIDLTHVIDTSGAYIPGHGTPTVILFGRARKPVGETVRAVLGIKGEPATPDDPAQGIVWRSIVKQIDQANAEDGFTSTADVPRATFAKHPWSIGGGGASDLKDAINENSLATLSEVVELVGVFGMTNADEVYLADKPSFRRFRVEPTFLRQLQLGDEIRDWKADEVNYSIFPYKSDKSLVALSDVPALHQWLWPTRTLLGNRATFGKGTYFSEGLPWWKWHQITLDRLRTPLSIAFAFVATHNHFVLDRGGKVFNRSAPIIKLPADATEDNHLALLGLLNSSTACFWMKQNFQTKGSSGIGRGVYDERWEFFYEHTGTGLERFPIPKEKPLDLARHLDSLSQQYARLLPETTVQSAMPTAQGLAEARRQAEAIRGRMIALQEELDWHCYQLYGLLSDDLRYTGNDLPELALGQRAFEIVMARQMAKGELQTTWFERHGSTPITEIPSHWPAAYRKLVERRIKLIETNKEIGLIEKPEYKRRWNAEPWEQQEQRALRNWLLDWLEKASHGKPPELTTAARLADRASGNAEFMQVAALYRGRPDFDVSALVAELVESESVPFLPVLRYKPSGLRKREVWERTWELQREEDRLHFLKKRRFEGLR